MGKKITKEILQKFIKKLEEKGFEQQISMYSLDDEVREHFGMSPQTIRNYKKLLVHYGFLKPIGTNIFEINSEAFTLEDDDNDKSEAD